MGVAERLFNGASLETPESRQLLHAKSSLRCWGWTKYKSQGTDSKRNLSHTQGFCCHCVSAHSGGRYFLPWQCEAQKQKWSYWTCSILCSHRFYLQCFYQMNLQWQVRTSDAGRQSLQTSCLVTHSRKAALQRGNRDTIKGSRLVQTSEGIFFFLKMSLIRNLILSQRKVSLFSPHGTRK